MKKIEIRKSTLIIGGILLALLLLFMNLYIFKTKTDTRTVRTQASLTTHELFKELQTKDDYNLTKYIEKAIEIKGVIKEITLRDGVYSIVLEGDGGERHIICEMQKGQDAEILSLLVGQEVIVKGILKGLLMDAILLNCIIV